MTRLRVLFLCTGNSARSQMAEALFRQLSRGRAEVFSAGTHPQPQVHPMAITVLREQFKIDTSQLYPKHLAEFVGQSFDYVFTVCDRAAEACPVMPGDPERVQWSFEDPAAATGGDDVQRRAFETVAHGLAARLRIWMALPTIHRRLSSGELSTNEG